MALAIVPGHAARKEAWNAIRIHLSSKDVFGLKNNMSFSLDGKISVTGAMECSWESVNQSTFRWQNET